MGKCTECGRKVDFAEEEAKLDNKGYYYDCKSDKICAICAYREIKSLQYQGKLFCDPDYDWGDDWDENEEDDLW